MLYETSVALWLRVQHVNLHPVVVAYINFMSLTVLRSMQQTPPLQYFQSAVSASVIHNVADLSPFRFKFSSSQIVLYCVKQSATTSVPDILLWGICAAATCRPIAASCRPSAAFSASASICTIVTELGADCNRSIY